MELLFWRSYNAQLYNDKSYKFFNFSRKPTHSIFYVICLYTYNCVFIFIFCQRQWLLFSYSFNFHKNIYFYHRPRVRLY